MSSIDNLQTKIERWSLYFQGGIRRSVLIFLGIALVLLAPLFFLGQFSSYLFGLTWIDESNTVIEKTLVVNDFTVSQTQSVELINGEKDLYASINNKTNEEVGFTPWIYTTQILDGEGTILSQKTRRSYILPNDINFVVERSTDPAGKELKIITEPSTVPVKYNPNNESLQEPNLRILSSRIIDNIEGDNLIIEGNMINEDKVEIKTVNILFIIRDTRESVIGIGTYSFDGFKPGTERGFSLSYPKPKDREPKLLDLRWSVNYLDPTSFKF